MQNIFLLFIYTLFPLKLEKNYAYFNSIMFSFFFTNHVKNNTNLIQSQYYNINPNIMKKRLFEKSPAGGA